MLSKPAPPSDPSRRGADRGGANDNFDFWDPVATPLGGDDEEAGQSERAPTFGNDLDPENVAGGRRLLGRYFPFPLIVSLAVAFLVVLAISWSLWGGDGSAGR